MHPSEETQVAAAEVKRPMPERNEHELLEELFDAGQYFFTRLARLCGHYADQERKRAHADRLEKRIDSLEEERRSLLG